MQKQKHKFIGVEISPKIKGTIFVLICTMLWALIPVVAKLGQANLDSHQFLFWSSLVSFIVLSITATFTGKIIEVKHYSIKDWIYILLLGLLGTYIYYLFLYFGYSKAVGLEVLVIQYTWPIFVIVLSIFILKESLTLNKTAAITLGFIGVITVLTKGDFKNINVENSWVIALVIAGALCAALFSVLSKNIKKDPIVVVSIYFLSACIASFFSMLSFSDLTVPSTAELFPILINGILVNGYSYLFWLIALKSTEASYLAPFIFIAPILSAIYLVLFFNEPALPAYGIGLICVVTGGIVNSIGHIR
jgi:drug/metabolite transporter (DMT)-like permease